jgi:hypothetical protein
VNNVTRDYYVLSFPVQDTWDGRFHEIKVRVKRPGLEVHAQRGYFSPKPFKELSDFEKRLELFDLAVGDSAEEGSSIVVPAVAIPIGGGSWENCLAICTVPGGTLRESGGGRVEILQVVLNAQHSIVTGRRAELNLSSLPTKDAAFYGLFSLRPGDYRLRTVIRNLESGESAVGGVPITIATAPVKGLELSPPLLVLPEKPGSYVRITEAKSGGRSIHDLFVLLPDKSRLALDAVESGTKTVQAVLRCSAPELSTADLLTSVWILNRKTGESLRVVHKIVAAKKEYQNLNILLDLQLPPLAPDTYELWVSLKDAGTGAEAKSSCTLNII